LQAARYVGIVPKKTKRNKEILDFELRMARVSVFKVPDIIIVERRFFKSSVFGKLMQKLILFISFHHSVLRRSTP
jgi:hypothetical protein